MPFYSPSTGGFYTKQIHGRNMPVDVVEVSNRDYDSLLLAQRQGHEIAATPTGPIVKRHRHAPGVPFAHAKMRVQREARRRIIAIASLEQQSNDNAVLALAALKRVKGDSTVFLAAMERRQKIDAVREASNRIEAGLAGYTDEELGLFNAATAAWPS